MLSFAVFDSGGPAADWPLGAAHLLGPDETPTQGEIRLEGGIIVCDRASTDAAALAVQFPVELDGQSLGVLTLRTALLPDRGEPYLLSLELARHRIMLVLNKLEDWGLFDLQAEHPAMVQLEQARAEFTRALVALCHRDRTGDSPRADPVYVRAADDAARRALALALDSSEQLAALQAARQIRGRADGSIIEHAQAHAENIGPDRVLPEGAVKGPDMIGVALPQPAQIGCAIDPAAFTPELSRVVQASCDFVSMPMRWIDMEPTEGKYAFARTDKWIEWAVRTARLPVHAGPLISFSEIAVPEWLYIWEHDYETLRELVYEHIKTIVTRYRRTITRWTVCSGLHVNESFALNLEKMMDLTRMCALLVKKIHPAARIQIEIERPWGEYFARNKRSMPPKMYAEMIAQAGIQLDAYALKVQMGQPHLSRTTRDLAQFSDLLDRYAALDKPLTITAIGAPSIPVTTLPASRITEKSPALPVDPGRWRGPWTPEMQARWLTQFVGVALSKPFVSSVCWQELYDRPGADMPHGGLLGEAGQPKPAAGALSDLRSQARQRAAARPT
jgi:hypothetical protein